MADTLAIVARKVFDEQAGAVEPGDGPLPWSRYASDHPLLNKYLEPGDRLFLVTVKPGPPRERLWLVSVYETSSKALTVGGGRTAKTRYTS